jgi:hypothetical protein
LNAVASSCQSFVIRVIAGDRPLLVPRNCSNARPKSEEDRPCRYNSGSTPPPAATSAPTPAGSPKRTAPLPGDLIDSLDVDPRRPDRTAPSDVVTSRSAWKPLRTTSRRLASSSSSLKASM